METGTGKKDWYIRSYSDNTFITALKYAVSNAKCIYIHFEEFRLVMWLGELLYRARSLDHNIQIDATRSLKLQNNM